MMDKEKFHIKEITPEETYLLRHQILRPHQSFAACQYDTDHDADTFHLGAFTKEKLIGTASFYHEPTLVIVGAHSYRLRAMGVLQEYRGRSAGRALILDGQKRIKNAGGDLLWCKGRTSVQPFYEKLGFSPYGDVFDYPPTGPHIILYKKLFKEEETCLNKMF
ncbi:GNAT family N-acetyltransferase [Halobacillus litoralis]|uniref:GNAT family N-acetyltransferase n=1 Tax=Halobacillus litoralis TaxID=45668 RepID=UPI001CD26055|nr:GNAT family N-acetyltransferase [Halobacillus litoralis]MCA1023681.1 GNAT family N-acetyltransferase [Halobacillus litoralis]